MACRPKDSLVRDSPSFGGVTFLLQYGVDEGTDLDQIVGNVRYNGGPLSAGVAFMQTESAGGLEDLDVMRAAARYNLAGGFAVTGFWQEAQNLAGVDGADRSSYGIGASFQSGNNIFKAQYYSADDIDGTDETGGDLIAVGWDHLFSKTTKAYIVYAATSNDDNTNRLTVGGFGHAALVPTTGANVLENGGDTSGISVGMIVDF